MAFDSILTRLNKEQREVATAPRGHMSINAAAGTGKTSTLAARILFLQLEMDIPSDSILALSFSRTARARILQKLEDFCLEAGMGSSVPVYTFHGLAYRILRLAIQCNETWLRPNFELVSNSRDGLNNLFRNNAKYLLSNLKSAQEVPAECYLKILDELRQGSTDMEAIISPKELPSNQIIEWSDGQRSFLIPTNDLKTCWTRYIRLFQKYNCVDYNGLIAEAINLLKIPDSQTSMRVRNGLKFLLVDEYQDTSRSQERLLFSIVQSDISLNVVGDAGQTIYTFNGSSITNILEFGDRIRQQSGLILPSVSLVRNYRSTNNIIGVANRIMQETATRNKLIPELKIEGDLVNLVHAPSLQLAADYIATEIPNLLSIGNIKPHEICILVRKDTEFSPQGAVVQAALESLGLDVTMVKEKDAQRTHEILNYISEICMDPEYYVMSISDFLEKGCYLNLINMPEGVDAGDIKMHFDTFMDGGLEFCYEVSDEIFSTLEDNIETGMEVQNGNIQVRTIHSTKGEEFKAVFLLYLGDRTFPHGSSPDIEEERRLLYVGITRAREKLHIIGRPGIHFDSFFEECVGEGVRLVKHLALSGYSPLEMDLEQESENIRLVNEVRRHQEELNQQYRAELLDFFKNDF